MTGAKSLQPRCVELFTGAGGLALGVERAGYEHLALVEYDHDACETLRVNSRKNGQSVWPIFEEDVHEFDFSPFQGKVELLAAGAPCQPWSLGGKHGGFWDDRNLFPQVFRATRELAPEIILIENVQGLLRASFAPFFDYFLKQLTAPDLTIRRDEDWREHSARLSAHIASGVTDLGYHVSFQRVDAADFGVPQRRRRVFIVAFRNDLQARGARWIRLEPTHSEEALLYSQWVTGEYWDEHQQNRRRPPPSLLPKVERLRGLLLSPQEKRWRTVRDGICHLPEPGINSPANIANHVGRPGARSYPGHTGSAIDEPAKTLKAGDHGVPGGENMLRLENGRVRYFTVREAAVLQGFPDDYLISGAWSEGFRQLGNAVPVDLAELFAKVARGIASAAKASADETMAQTTAQVA